MQILWLSSVRIDPREKIMGIFFHSGGIFLIVGVGTDIIEVARIEKAIRREKFMESVFTPAEREYCRTAEQFSARWAAKESVMKALGTGMRGGSFVEIEILHDAEGSPRVELRGNFARVAENIGVRKIHISLSHEKKFATAFCVLES